MGKADSSRWVSLSSVICAIPVIVLFFLAQRSFIEGIKASDMK